MELTKLHENAEMLESAFKLRTFPIGVKFCETLAEVPAGAVFPKKTLGKHMALCQAFSYARMKGMTIAMTKEDHWCWNPLVGFGSVECVPGQEQFDEVVKYIGIPDKLKAEAFFAHFPRLPLGKYEAVVIAPVTVLMHYLMVLMARPGLDRIVVNSLTMFIATLAALALSMLPQHSNVSIVIITLSMLVIPGIPLVNAMRNLLCGFEMNGIFQLLKVTVETLALGIGIFIAFWLIGPEYTGGSAAKGVRDSGNSFDLVDHVFMN